MWENTLAHGCGLLCRRSVASCRRPTSTSSATRTSTHRCGTPTRDPPSLPVHQLSYCIVALSHSFVIHDSLFQAGVPIPFQGGYNRPGTVTRHPHHALSEAGASDTEADGGIPLPSEEATTTQVLFFASSLPACLCVSLRGVSEPGVGPVLHGLSKDQQAARTSGRTHTISACWRL